MIVNEFLGIQEYIMKKLLYKILKKDMIKKLSKKHGEQFIDDVMETFGIPSNLMDKYKHHEYEK